jgi:hypothetical protein
MRLLSSPFTFALILSVLAGCPAPTDTDAPDAGLLGPDAFSDDVPSLVDSGVVLGGPCGPGGRVECDGNEATHECVDDDGDGNGAWGPRTVCPGETTCDRGICSDTCTDDCHLGQIGCFPREVARLCGQFDRDPCADWGEDLPCGPDQVCNLLNGPSPALCVDCDDENDHASCGPAARVCRNQECVPPPGRCVEAGSGVLDVEVPGGVPTGHLSFFYALSGVAMGNGISLWLTAPDGTSVFIDRCIVSGNGAFSELLSDTDTFLLAPLAGHVSAGTWNVSVSSCRSSGPVPGGEPPGAGPTLENWAVCFNP